MPLVLVVPRLEGQPPFQTRTRFGNRLNFNHIEQSSGGNRQRQCKSGVCRKYKKEEELAAFWVLGPMLSKAAQSHKISKNSRLTVLANKVHLYQLKGEKR